MPILLDPKQTIYRPYMYTKEADFERDVVESADQIFGPSSVYVNVKRKVSGNKIVTIPDGYLIDMAEPEEPKLFIVENEIVSHDPFQHIGIQMLKFVTSFEGAKHAIRGFLMHEIMASDVRRARLEEGCSRSADRNVDAYLDRAVYGDFRGLVVIDSAQSELHRVIEKINANISVIEFKTFVAGDGRRVHQFDTLYDEEEEAGGTTTTPAPAADSAAARRARLAKCDTVVVPAHEDGFRETFVGENQWYKIRIGAAMKKGIGVGV